MILWIFLDADPYRTPPKKKRKLRAPARKCRFQKIWTENFEHIGRWFAYWVDIVVHIICCVFKYAAIGHLIIFLSFLCVASAKEMYQYRCLACNKSLSCSHQGKADVERHTKSDQHKQAVKLLKDQTTFESGDTNEVNIFATTDCCTNECIINNIWWRVDV